MSSGRVGESDGAFSGWRDASSSATLPPLYPLPLSRPRGACGRRVSLPVDVQAVNEALKSFEKKKGGLGGAAPHGIKCRACMRDSEGEWPADGDRPRSGWRARVLMPDDSLHCTLKDPHTPSGSSSSSERAAY